MPEMNIQPGLELAAPLFGQLDVATRGSVFFEADFRRAFLEHRMARMPNGGAYPRRH
jgi:hypothetical protein